MIERVVKTTQAIINVELPRNNALALDESGAGNEVGKLQITGKTSRPNDGTAKIPKIMDSAIASL